MLSLIVLALWFGSAAAEPVALRPEAWTTSGDVAFGPHKGLDALTLKQTSAEAVANGLSFANGTIEFDVEPQGVMGVGISFHRRDTNNLEDVYFRPKPNCDTAIDCVQYAPKLRGVLLWDFYPQYQHAAALHDGTWNHVKLVISGRRMNLSVNGTPALTIGRLEGDETDGSLMLHGPGVFANLTVTRDAVEEIAAEPERDASAADPRFVRDWQLAPISVLFPDQEPVLADMPPPKASWRTIAAERGGLLNISRLYGKPVPAPNRALAWLKTTITSKKAETKTVHVGWCREVWVFVNGRPVFADKNPYQPPAARKAPDGRCTLENGTFALPLKAGTNDITVALANNFYGWGLILRFDDAPR
jgi:hypothetical protein